MTDPAPESNQEPSNETRDPSEEPEVDHGPGWLPAVMAAVVLMGIVGCILCAFTTWVLFQKRTELAIRTLGWSLPAPDSAEPLGAGIQSGSDAGH